MPFFKVSVPAGQIVRIAYYDATRLTLIVINQNSFDCEISESVGDFDITAFPLPRQTGVILTREDGDPVDKPLFIRCPSNATIIWGYTTVRAE